MFNRYFFSYRLNLSKRAHNLTNTMLSVLLGLKSRTSINDFESQRSLPSADVLYDISGLFGVSIDWLAGRLNEPYYNEVLLNLEKTHLERLSVDFDKNDADITIDFGSYFLKDERVQANYVDSHKRIELFSLPVRANIVFLFCWFQKETEYFITMKHPFANHNFSDLKKRFFAIWESSAAAEKRRNIAMKNFDIMENLLTMKMTVPVFDITKPLKQK